MTNRCRIWIVVIKYIQNFDIYFIFISANILSEPIISDSSEIESHSCASLSNLDFFEVMLEYITNRSGLMVNRLIQSINV